MSVDVTLDNSRSEDDTTYVVTRSLASEDEPESWEAYDLLAGAVKNVLVPVTENVPVNVDVYAAVDAGEAEEGFLVGELFRVNCTPGDEPLASIGEIVCANLTVPVTLDNTRSPMKSWFEVTAGDERGFEDPTFYDGFWVTAGAERVVAARVANNARVAVSVVDNPQFGALAHTVLDVNCPSTAARPTVAVGGAMLPETGGFNLAVPLLGVALLVGGAGMLALTGRRHDRVIRGA
jgi:hypothetical protein